MKTNDLKQGARVILRSGWYATIADNRRGNVRLVTVSRTETGSEYAHNIVKALVDGTWIVIEHTPAQHDLMARVAAALGD